uniref:Lytic polysaccharide monooxygenase B n=1 Tax=Coptotermes gestroi TaxID=232242 RepID=A0A896IAA7_9NEOP|nr:lytic polysaccharide monooxygenase B [Coptotermes gestroi]
MVYKVTIALPLLSFALITPWLLYNVEAHGRLIEPPSRATMWRYGFSTPPNYNDHELYCGGFTRQWQRNGGKCGICGDAWDMPVPRPHEAGGKYAQGIIVRRYKKDSAITIRVELTANHRGYFEFRLCPNNAPRHAGTQACLDKYVLRRAKFAGVSDEQSHETRYYPAAGNKVFETRYLLPHGLTCTQCILQWKYIAGNNWGICENGTGAVGCGPQEEFRACADVEIVDSSGLADETPFYNEIPTHDENKNTDEITGSTEQTPVPEPATNWWLMTVIAICALIAVAVTLALVYFYYYHAGDAVKRWLGSERFQKQAQQTQQPVPPPRVKKQQSSNINPDI